MNDKYSIEFMVSKGIPSHTAHTIQNYIVDRLQPGSFIRAVVRNNLMDAFSYADVENLEAIKEIVMYFYNYAPMECWGSEENYNNWMGRN